MRLRFKCIQSSASTLGPTISQTYSFASDFTTPGTYTFVVPLGVRSIYVNAWGSGGGGGSGAGGAGGGSGSGSAAGRDGSDGWAGARGAPGGNTSLSVSGQSTPEFILDGGYGGWEGAMGATYAKRGRGATTSSGGAGGAGSNMPADYRPSGGYYTADGKLIQSYGYFASQGNRPSSSNVGSAGKAGTSGTYGGGYGGSGGSRLSNTPGITYGGKTYGAGGWGGAGGSGGSGGGGLAASNYSGGGGGGGSSGTPGAGGGFVAANISVNPGQTITIVVGAGGKGATTVGSAGAGGTKATNGGTAGSAGSAGQAGGDGGNGAVLITYDATFSTNTKEPKNTVWWTSFTSRLLNPDVSGSAIFDADFEMIADIDWFTSSLSSGSELDASINVGTLKSSIDVIEDIPWETWSGSSVELTPSISTDTTYNAPFDIPPPNPLYDVGTSDVTMMVDYASSSALLGVEKAELPELIPFYEWVGNNLVIDSAPISIAYLGVESNVEPEPIPGWTSFSSIVFDNNVSNTSASLTLPEYEGNVLWDNAPVVSNATTAFQQTTSIAISNDYDANALFDLGVVSKNSDMTFATAAQVAVEGEVIVNPIYESLNSFNAELTFGSSAVLDDQSETGV